MSSIKSGAPAALITIKNDRPLSERELLGRAGYDPDKDSVHGVMDQSIDLVKALYVYKFRVREGVLSWADIRDGFRTTRTARFKNVESNDRIRIVIYTDPQWGKTDANGGTPETQRRSADIRDQVFVAAERDKPGTIVMMDGGDGVENFHNVASQARTNDLSMTGQQRAYLADTREWAVGLHRRCTDFHFAACISNHGREKGPSGYVAEPFADYGYYNAWVLQQLMDAAGLSATFHLPQGHAESVALEVGGFKLGLVHGHLGELEKWWKGQQLGDNAVADADFLFAGHNHNPTFKYVSGNKMAFQGASLDNGSSWLTNMTGQSAPAGVVTLDLIRGVGFDTHSWRFYTER